MYFNEVPREYRSNIKRFSLSANGWKDQNMASSFSRQRKPLYGDGIVRLANRVAVWRHCFCFVRAFSFQGHTKIAPSSMRRRVSSSDETPRKELKIRLAHRSIFDDFRGVSSGVESVSNAWYYFSDKIRILAGEIKDVKMSSFSSDFQTLIK